jgi:hypothetical protein
MADVALVLSSDHYTIPDDKGVEQNLFQVWYINQYREASERELGSKPIKILCDAAVFQSLRAFNLPALCSLDFSSRPGKGGAAALVLSRVQHLSNPPIFEVPTKAKAA